LGYHNHSFEFNQLPSGKMPIECILDHNENLKFEIDLGWVVAGKQDPLIWIKKYGYKLIACHLKDFYSKDKDLIDYKEQCAIGEGFIDWATIISEVKKTNCKIFAIEHDDPEDYKDYTSRSLNYLSTIE
jgi:sugar phosphate isomerase/epimerase